MDRQIIHTDMDCFFAAVEVLKDSTLKNKPIAVGGNADRGVLTSVSYEAKKLGINSGMPTRVAMQMCPQLHIVKGNMDEYSKYSHTVTEIIRELSPVVEKAAIDEHYIDMTGMDKYFGTMKFAHELRQKVISETGLPLSFGLSVNKTVSKIVTNESKPNGEGQIMLPQVQEFLNPLSIKKIPGIGHDTYLKLSEMGVRKIYTLIQIPAEMMFRVMGQSGITLWQKGNGIDNAPVVPYRENKSISDQRDFLTETIDIERIKALLATMITELAYELRKQQKLTACITVTIRYANFETVTRQEKIAYTSLDFFLLQKATALFNKAYDRRMLLRLVGIRFSHLVGGFEQIDLYNAVQEQYSLYQSMDNIRNRFGKKAVVLASSLKPNPKPRPQPECKPQNKTDVPE
ncbi:DNA polymerase IV [Mucilaginibacter sp.]|uniref:DNA polymerase IV n=1 Tax=Mucilaginibacter sp. TaxID=1882438 RepID=UPI003D0B2774